MIRDLEIFFKKRTILWASGGHWTSLLVFLNNRSRSYDCAVREKALPQVRNPLVDHSKSLPLQCKPISSPVSGEMGTAAERLLTRPLWSGAGPSLWSVYHIARHAGQFLTNWRLVTPTLISSPYSPGSLLVAQVGISTLGTGTQKAPGLRSISQTGLCSSCSTRLEENANLISW